MTGNPEQGSGNIGSMIARSLRANAWGIASFIPGLTGVFLLAPIFAPLALLFGAIALAKRQWAWGVPGLLCGAIGFFYMWGWLMS